MQVPKTADEWKTIADGFYRKWNFPNCLGAVDGKHIAITKPPDTGSFYYNYKNFFSVVLMAVVDSNYDFIMADVGINGRFSDGAVFQHTSFGKAFYENSLSIPEPDLLPESEKILPYVFIADDAFQLSDNFMKPFAQHGLTNGQKIFNYRLNRARRIVENAFGILSSRFGIFQKPMNLSPEKVQVVVLACCYLHNFLRSKSQNTFSSDIVDVENVETATFVKGSWRENYELTPLQSTLARNSCDSAKQIREAFMEYFNSEGQVSWQNHFNI